MNREKIMFLIIEQFMIAYNSIIYSLFTVI